MLLRFSGHQSTLSIKPMRFSGEEPPSEEPLPTLTQEELTKAGLGRPQPVLITDINLGDRQHRQAVARSLGLSEMASWAEIKDVRHQQFMEAREERRKAEAKRLGLDESTSWVGIRLFQDLDGCRQLAPTFGLPESAPPEEVVAALEKNAAQRAEPQEAPPPQFKGRIDLNG
jgi:hypothetical protein